MAVGRLTAINDLVLFSGFMSSIHTNVTAMAALQTLRSVDASLSDEQQTVSSGLRVGKASDNAAYWSIATSMRSDNSVLSTVSDSIGIAKGIMDITYNGMDNVLTELTKIRNLVVGARDLPTPDIDMSIGTGSYMTLPPDTKYDQSEMAKVDQEIVQHFEQITSIVKSSSFAGINLLSHQATGKAASASTIDFVTGYSEKTGIQTTSVSLADTTMIDYNYNGVDGSAVNSGVLGGFLDGTYLVTDPSQSQTTWGTIAPVTYIPSTTVEDSKNHSLLRGIEWWAATNGTDPKVGFDGLVTELDKRIENITSGMSKVGSVQKRLDAQDDFTSRLSDTLTKGIGRLVDADMNVASTRIKALQTQQQLAVQSLSIANSQPQNIMQLFK